MSNSSQDLIDLAERLTIEMDGREVTLGPGEVYVVPEGVEPAATPNTGEPATAAAKTLL